MESTTTYRNAGVLLAYPLAFAYFKYFLYGFGGDFTFIWRAVVALGFIALNIIVVKGREKTVRKESLFWYAVMFIVSITSVTGISEPVSMLGLHCCAVYVAVVSCSLMIEGRTGSFIAADMLNAGVIKAMPGFINFGADIGSLLKGERKKKPVSVVAGIIGVLVMFPIFILAVDLLGGINAAFEESSSKFLNMMTELFDFFWVFKNMGFIIGAVPVAFYMYGLLSSCAQGDGANEKKAHTMLVSWRQKCRKVPEIMAALITSSFVILYLIFFCFEGSYLFSAFVGKLPDAYTAAEYARKGFFELTGIMFINMLVFFLVNYFTDKKNIFGKISSGVMIALMSESIVFAVVSFSKLALYYSRFGYTPKRLLAMWGTLIFAAGAVMVIAAIVKKKDMSGKWIYFTAGSFAFMNLLSTVISLAT